MLLEICANSYQSAKNAEDTGAHRIELCQELSVGGITPSYGLLKQVLENLSIPVFVLIRPRRGHFVYTDVEFEIMKTNIQICKDLGCAGIVSGILKEDNTIDIERTKQLVELSKPLPFTFHRAFDEVSNPKEAIQQLIDLGVERILTSGQETSAEKGIELLKELNYIADNRIILLVGGGVNAENAVQFKNARFSEIHASVSLRLSSVQVSKLSTDNSFFSVPLTYSDPEKIEAILKVIKGQ